MNKKFNVIKLSGFKGLLLILFLGACLLTGFLVFPGWICMQIWNYASSFITDAPVMQLTHGVILWCIIALSFYALNKGNLSISLNSVHSPSEERIRKILSEESREILFPQKEMLEEKKEQEKETDKVTK